MRNCKLYLALYDVCLPAPRAHLASFMCYVAAGMLAAAVGHGDVDACLVLACARMLSCQCVNYQKMSNMH